jgi:hypothetical protein
MKKSHFGFSAIVLVPLILLAMHLLGCETTQIDELEPFYSGDGGSGVWCVSFYNSYGAERENYLEKYSYTGKLVYRGPACGTISRLGLESNTGLLYSQVDNGRLQQRIQTGMIVNEEFLPATIMDLSINQTNGDIWVILKGDGSEDEPIIKIVRLNREFEVLLDYPVDKNPEFLSCNSSDNSCWVIIQYYDQNRILQYYLTKLSVEGETLCQSTILGDRYIDTLKTSSFDGSCWIGSNLYIAQNFLTHFSANGEQLQEWATGSNKIRNIEIDPLDGSVYIAELQVDYENAGNLKKIDAAGNLLWSLNLLCKSIAINSDSIWVAVKPNKLMQFTKDGQILTQFYSQLYSIIDIVAWNG